MPFRETVLARWMKFLEMVTIREDDVTRRSMPPAPPGVEPARAWQLFVA